MGQFLSDYKFFCHQARISISKAFYKNEHHLLTSTLQRSAPQENSCARIILKLASSSLSFFIPASFFKFQNHIFRGILGC